eukprot:6473929-Amphidinium_carterae.2
MPFLWLASSTRSKHTKPDKQYTKVGSITHEDFQGNQEADVVANLGAAAHAPHETTAEYLRWELVAQAVRVFWLLVAPKLRERPEAWLRAALRRPRKKRLPKLCLWRLDL